jgi:ABC-type lipoprotein release transport system permease subunit
MRILLKLAWRNIWRNRKRSLITISSVLFAVLLAIVFKALEVGSYSQMIENMVRYSTGYIQVQDVLYEEEPSMDHSLLYDQNLKAAIEQYAYKISFTVPRIQHFALAATPTQTRGIMVMGIDPEAEAKMNDLTQNMQSGAFLAPGDTDIVLANGLAEILRVSVGDSLVLLGQGFQGATAAGVYRVKGIVNIRLPDLSNSIVYMSLEAAQWFFMADGRLTSLIVMPQHPRETNQLAASLLEAVDPEWLTVVTWEHLLKDILAMMRFDQAGSLVMMLILYIVIGFGLLGTILTMIMERQREFNMLLSLGMKRRVLAGVCFTETLFISFAGILAGILVSIPIVLFFHHNPIPLTGDVAQTMVDFGFEPVIPFAFEPRIFIEQVRVVTVLSLLVGLYPVYKVFRMKTIQIKK